jgi:hypothetical protein
MVSYSLLIVFFINRDPCNIVTYTISIQCSPLYTSALSLSYISPIYLTWYQSHFLVAFNKCLWRFQAYVLLMLYDCLIISVAHMPPHASKIVVSLFHAFIAAPFGKIISKSSLQGADLLICGNPTAPTTAFATTRNWQYLHEPHVPPSELLLAKQPPKVVSRP